MTQKKILVIDDDTRLRNLLGKFLEENNFSISLAKDVQEARALMQQSAFDLLIVDVMLPGENGIDFTASTKKSSSIPILILTARGDSSDRIKGLEVGADDYLPKPFDPKELLLRINNILRRESPQKIATQGAGNICKFGNFTFNLDNSRLTKDSDFVYLTEGEAKILFILCKEKENVVSRESLSSLLGGLDYRSVDVQITRLRKKIESNPKQPNYIQTVRNKGYILHE